MWDDVHDEFLKFVDGPKLVTSNFENTFKVAADALRILKGECPEVVSTIVLWTMPRKDEPWGVCSILPSGLPILKSEDTSDILLKSILQSVDKVDLTDADPKPKAKAKTVAKTANLRLGRQVSMARVRVQGAEPQWMSSHLSLRRRTRRTFQRCCGGCVRT